MIEPLLEIDKRIISILIEDGFYKENNNFLLDVAFNNLCKIMIIINTSSILLIINDHKTLAKNNFTYGYSIENFKKVYNTVTLFANSMKEFYNEKDKLKINKGEL
jgi:hypothetical protein